MKFKFILAGFAVLALALIVIRSVVTTPRNNSRPTDASFRTIDDAFGDHLRQGWSLTSAPTDGKRYRICGATQSDPNSGLSSFSGSFKTDGRSIDFDVKVPDGTVVAVEGLEPIDGGPLTYAVLVRDVPD